MASVVGCVLGGSPQRLQAGTVADVKRALRLDGNYTASVDGEPADDGTLLSDEQFVSLAPAVKGG